MRAWQSQRAISSLPSAILSPLQLNQLLQLCSNSKALNAAKQTHQQTIILGLDSNPFMTTKLLQAYADCDNISTAHILFDKLPQPNVYAWTAILAFYSRNGMVDGCLTTYSEMKRNGVVPDGYVFPKILRACAGWSCLDVATQVHNDVIVCGVDINVVVSNSLIDMYSKCRDVGSARRIFNEMVERDLLSWNSMISGYVLNGFLGLAVELLNFMRCEAFEPDLVTWNTIMDAYCRMGQCDEAWKILERIREPNIISWTTLISGYSRIGEHDITLGIFREMVNKGKVFPDLDCLSSVLVSCRHMGLLICGRQIHAYGIKAQPKFVFYKSAGPALLTMYARCKRFQEMKNVFDSMDKCDVVTWNAMILGFADMGKGFLAVDCFREMQTLGIENDQTTISTILPVSDLKSGKQIHTYIMKSSLNSVIPIQNALIHMYAKCGCIQTAYSLFSQMVCKDLVTWNTMIGGFGSHGFGRSALQLLQEMFQSGVSPNSATFTSVLSACSHSGLVDEGLEIYHKMTGDFHFQPRMEHFACVVDLLTRSGKLEDAVTFIEKMPVRPDKHIWGAVLAASQAQQNTSFGVLASEHLVQLEPANAGHYVTLSNMHARAGRWDDALAVRKLVDSRGLVKPSGYSWIENQSSTLQE